MILQTDGIGYAKHSVPKGLLARSGRTRCIAKRTKFLLWVSKYLRWLAGKTISYGHVHGSGSLRAHAWLGHEFPSSYFAKPLSWVRLAACNSHPGSRSEYAEIPRAWYGPARRFSVHGLARRFLKQHYGFETKNKQKHYAFHSSSISVSPVHGFEPRDRRAGARRQLPWIRCHSK